jgi:hypothetical protein
MNLTEQTLDEIESFLGKIVFEIAYRPTKDEASRLLNKLRLERNSRLPESKVSAPRTKRRNRK